jgi:hypothetical protein
MLLCITACNSGPAIHKPSSGTAEAQAAWKPLFDGKTTEGWRGYGREGFPSKGWVVEDGTLRVMAGGGGGDIMTVDQYQEFDLRLEWKVGEKANSGIMYLVSEHEKASWQTGPEYQIFDDMGHNAKPTDMHSTGSMYDLYAPPADKPVKPAGEWNHTRILIQGNRIEHWINGKMIVDCDLAGEDWEKRRAKSKFAVYEKFGRNRKGHIALQDHGNDVWFRNIRILDLSPAIGKKPEKLFNGKDLSGWAFFTEGDEKKEEVWSVQNGVLICKGEPYGYLYTEADYKNYILKLQWRFNPETKQAGNSGVLLRVQEPHKVWPQSVEGQLQSGSAGDFWCIGDYPMKADPGRTKGRNTKKTHNSENPVGEWNQYEIVVDKEHVTLIVNGEVLNRAHDVAVKPGKIAVQSEGVEIHFRNIEIIPL